RVEIRRESDFQRLQFGALAPRKWAFALQTLPADAEAVQDRRHERSPDNENPGGNASRAQNRREAEHHETRGGAGSYPNRATRRRSNFDRQIELNSVQSTGGPQCDCGMSRSIRVGT